MPLHRQLLGLALLAGSIAGPTITVRPARGDAPAGPPPVQVDAAVTAALAVHPAVAVIVMLRKPAAVAKAPGPAPSIPDPAAIATARAAVLADLDPAEFGVTRRYHAIPALAGRLTAGGLARLQHHPAVRAVGQDLPGSGGLDSSSPFIHADLVHGQGMTGRGVRVAVLDTGIDIDHPAFAGRIVAENCFVTLAPGCPPGPHRADDDHGHGTNVGGIVAMGRFESAEGIAPRVEIVAVKVMNNHNRFITSDLLAALDWLIGRADVRVANLSLGTDTLYAGACDTADAATEALAAAIGALRAQGTLVVAASLNNGSAARMTAPACVRHTVAVGAVYDMAIGAQGYGPCRDGTTAPNQIACFSNGNAELDLLAPGVAVLSAGRGGHLSTFTGTSQAAPHVAGAIALLAERSPRLSPDQIEAALRHGGVPVTDPRNGVTTPRLDIAKAIEIGERAVWGEVHLPWVARWR